MNINEVINISSKADLKGFKQAETASQKLGKTVKNLAGAFGLAFGTAAVLNYAKVSIKAAADDQKAQQQLALALKNVGLERDAASTEEYISGLESEFGILDDLLRPAYQTLAIATQNTAESQRLLNLALDISASTGKDVGSVTTALSRAYLGNNTALTRLGVGLSKADLKTKSFEENTNQLANTFAGSAATAASTFSGQLGILSAGASAATEIIGTGLIDSLKLLSGDTSVDNLTTSMKEAATATAETTVAVSKLIKEITEIPVVGDFLGRLVSNPLNLPKELLVFGQGGLLDYTREYGKLTKQIYGGAAATKYLGEVEAAAAKKRAQADRLARLAAQKIADTKKKQLATERSLLAEKKKQEILDKASLALAQGQKVFDEEGIQLTAAAQGKLTEEERTRLALKTDIFNLEAAINEGNVTAAAQLANSMVANAQKLAALRTDMIGLNDVQNPFTNWLATLKDMAMELSKIANIKPSGSSASTLGNRNMLGPITQDELENLAQARIDYSAANVGFNPTMGSSTGTSVVVNVAGSVSTERDLVAAITQGLYSQQASGTPVTYSTVY